MYLNIPTQHDINPTRYKPLNKNKPAYGDGKRRYGFIYTTYLVLWKIFIKPSKTAEFKESLKNTKENRKDLFVSLVTLIYPKTKLKHTQSYYDEIERDIEWRKECDEWVEEHVESMHRDYGRNYDK